jgi:hypothetical protein
MGNTRSAAEVAKALEEKGMECDEAHHHMFRKTLDGVTTLVTRLSHSGGEVDDGLGKMMANQCCLQLREFWNLVDCPLSADEWDKLVAERCMGGRNPFLGR